MINKPVVIITGVSSGIGLASARLFSSRGWVVVGTVRDRDYSDELAAHAVDVQMAEMTEPKDLERVVRVACRTYGRIDALVSNAGYALAGPLESLVHDQIMQQLSVNVGAAAELCRHVLPIMRKQERGAIVGVASIAGRVGLPGYSAYCASKFALEGLLESLWYEVVDSGIQVRIVEPSSVRTNFWTKGLVDAAPGKAYQGAGRLIAKAIAEGQIHGLSADEVATIVYKAVTSSSNRLHYGMGWTGPVVIARTILPDRLFRAVAKRFLSR